jgi:predicted nucleotidyltransferase
MLSTLITSKTRIKLLLKFFLNAETSGYLKSLASEFEESSNGIRIELNKFEEAGLLKSVIQGNKKIFKANTVHPMFPDIHRIILNYVGIDQIIEGVLSKLGELKKVYLTGALAKGLESKIIDIILIGNVNKEYLIHLIDKIEPELKKRIRYVIYSEQDFTQNKQEILEQDHLLIWHSDF